ncbi:uncharacterized protein LOC129757625 [Uranotaenia lowii]|uniref:uncharacterized protein LOC129757625 n=1 Tax=Uranotaenia lowii TaxID=190385 RepID=UPI0024788DFE|nr:uncharacterized protein LOC129757625 [Uranotaenia lowii]
MPKTVPKSANVNHDLAGGPGPRGGDSDPVVPSPNNRTGTGRSGLKRNRRELEPNEETTDRRQPEGGSSPKRRPNHSDEPYRQRRPDQGIIPPAAVVPPSQNNFRINLAVPNHHQHPPSPPISPPSAEDPRSNFLLQALRRIQELQDEIEFLENDPYAEDADDNSSDDSDEFVELQPEMIVGRQAEAVGFAVCARETMAFLEREGVAADSPMMATLRNRLIGRCERNMTQV